MQNRLNIYLRCVINIFPSEDPVVQGHCCVIIDQLKHLQTCHLCRLQDCPALCLVEKCWNCDHCIFYWLLCESERKKS